jgi:hypothetical protein
MLQLTTTAETEATGRGPALPHQTSLFMLGAPVHPLITLSRSLSLSMAANWRGVKGR